MARSWVFVVWVLVLALAASMVAGMARSDAAVGDVRLSEILAGPARDWDGDLVYDARKDEWVEIVNAGGAPVDLSPYRVADADSTIRYAFTGTLAPGAVRLVTGSAAEAWQRAVGRTVTGLSLNNAGDTVRLFRVSGTDTSMVDVKTYNAIEGASDRSTGVAPGSDAWMLFDGLNPYTGSGEPKGTGCSPTPNAENGCPAAVGEVTWGVIKTLIR
jgi:hypothetical protein